MSSLFSELKRRHVFRVAAAYLVIGWLLAQVLGLAASSFDAPLWVMKMIITLLAVGFIPTILFSWAYELTPEGLKKDSEVDPTQANTSQTANKLNVVTLIAVIAAAGMFVYQLLNPIPESTSAEGPAIQSQEIGAETMYVDNEVDKGTIDDASIAVLPFTDLSPAGDQEYFSDGIAEEILNVLVRVDSLKVASRTSAFGFKGQEALGIPLIAERLKVRHVLEGSVRKAGDTVRITAQLIDAQTDQHLWSQTYDRPLTAENIFTIQDDVSSEIVKSLRNHLGVELGDTQAVNFDTENLDAYELYLQARQLFFQRNLEIIPTIIELGKKATELDPTFAQAWAGLAATYSVATGWGVAGDNHFINAEAAAKKAIELDPDLALPYAVLANIGSGKIPIDFTKTIQLSNQALALDVNNSTAQLWRGIDELTLGFFERADVRFQTCLNIDPAYENCRRFLALTKLFAGETAVALELLDKSMLAGSTSQLDPFYRYFLINGDHRNGLLVLILNNNYFNIGLDVDMAYRRWTDPSFNFEQELILFLSQYEAKYKHKFDWDKQYIGPSIAYFIKKYDKLTPEPLTMYWWERSDPEFLKSPHRKRLIREMGIYDYWRKTEFPPQCRAVGDDDFECD